MKENKLKFIKGTEHTHEYFDIKGFEIWAYSDSLHFEVKGVHRYLNKVEAMQLSKYLNKVFAPKAKTK